MSREPRHVPVACRLSDAALREREATLLAQFRSGVIAAKELHDGYIFRIRGDKQWIEIAAALIAAERECCPFLAFTLTAAPSMGPAELRVAGPVGAKDFLPKFSAQAGVVLSAAPLRTACRPVRSETDAAPLVAWLDRGAALWQH